MASYLAFAVDGSRSRVERIGAYPTVEGARAAASMAAGCLGVAYVFDWAAQPFFSVVTTFIFGPYFVSRMASDPAAGQAAWGYAIAAAGFAIAILSPVLGSVADQTGPRKPWIAFFAAIKVVSLSMLWFAAPGSALIPPLIFFSLASIAAEFSIVFNDSMMPRLVAQNFKERGLPKPSNDVITALAEVAIGWLREGRTPWPSMGKLIAVQAAVAYYLDGV